MNKATQKLLVREAAILLLILLIGYVFYADGSKSFRYPLSARPEIKLHFLQLGKAIMIFGYPTLLLLRFGLKKLREVRKKE
ncbi:MAG: hypothetical protein ACE5IY_06725 [bacterium]